MSEGVCTAHERVTEFRFRKALVGTQICSKHHGSQVRCEAAGCLWGTYDLNDACCIVDITPDHLDWRDEGLSWLWLSLLSFTTKLRKLTTHNTFSSLQGTLTLTQRVIHYFSLC